MSRWYYADAGNQRQGPVASADLVGLRQQGALGWQTLVWREGMADWRPMAEFAGELAADEDLRWQSAAVPGAGSAAAPGGADVDSPYTPPTAPVAGHEQVVTGGEVVEAGFWKRFAALVIDGVVLSAAYYALLIGFVVIFGLGAASIFSMDGTGVGGLFAVLLGLVYLLYPVLSAIYFVAMETSSHQATLGKMAVGIKVVDRGGRKLGRGHALGRWFSHLLCYLTLYIGYLMVAFTRHKQGLHDMVNGTQVVDRWAYTAQPELQRRELGTVTLVVCIIGGLLVLLSLLAIVAAIAIPALAG
jgi:uncharacterized RDD family membrane protein YckC